MGIRKIIFAGKARTVATNNLNYAQYNIDTTWQPTIMSASTSLTPEMLLDAFNYIKSTISPPESSVVINIAHAYWDKRFDGRRIEKFIKTPIILSKLRDLGGKKYIYSLARKYSKEYKKKVFLVGYTSFDEEK